MLLTSGEHLRSIECERLSCEFVTFKLLPRRERMAVTTSANERFFRLSRGYS